MIRLRTTEILVLVRSICSSFAGAYFFAFHSCYNGLLQEQNAVRARNLVLKMKQNFKRNFKDQSTNYTLFTSISGSSRFHSSTRS